MLINLIITLNVSRLFCYLHCYLFWGQVCRHLCIWIFIAKICMCMRDEKICKCLGLWPVRHTEWPLLLLLWFMWSWSVDFLSRPYMRNWLRSWIIRSTCAQCRLTACKGVGRPAWVVVMPVCGDGPMDLIWIHQHLLEGVIYCWLAWKICADPSWKLVYDSV